MRNRLIASAALIAALALAGCSAGGSDASSSATETESLEAVSSEPTTVVVSGESAWSDSDDGSDAAANAGMETGFVVPESLPIGDYNWSAPHFTSMDNVAQADYDGGGPIAASVRKGEGVPLDELSSDLNEYAFDWAETVDEIEVSCHGYEEGIINFAEWEADGSSYDVWVVGVEGENLGMTPAELADVVAAVH